MSTTGLDVFDATVQKTNSWLNEIMDSAGQLDRQAAYRALRATLHALRDRLTIDETAQLSAQLPMLVRGIYYEGWDPHLRPPKERHKEQFLARIEQEFGTDGSVEPELLARAVFGVLEHRISEGEIKDVQQMLPAELRELWPVRR